MFGFLNVDKPRGMTSHDVVAAIRRQWGLKKVGHAGTLDPLATGVLIICLGGATRLSEYVMHQTKQYRAQITLGVKTDTYDSQGEVLEIFDSSSIAQHDFERVVTRFVGDIDQLPPMHSAIKQGGKKLYELARRGIEVERETRRVHIESIALIDWQLPIATIDIVCSAGTYIRSLAFDIGEALGVGAHMSALTRLASGSFTLHNASPLDTLLTVNDPHQFIVSSRMALPNYPALELSADEETELRYGRTIPIKQELPVTGTVAMGYNSTGHLVAVLKADDQAWKPEKVFE